MENARAREVNLSKKVYEKLEKVKAQVKQSDGTYVWSTYPGFPLSIGGLRNLRSSGKFYNLRVLISSLRY